MCGIHGVITGKTREPKAEEFCSQGFITGSLRGTDSSGMASIRTDVNDVSWQKLPISGAFFVGDNLMQRLCKDAMGVNTVTICHTRSATSGPVGINQAHPFYISNTEGREMIGVHNGSLNGWTTKLNAKDFKVDSEWALNHIFDYGLEAFDDFTGAFVFAWWDSGDSTTFNVALNDSRPLYVAFTKDGNMLYASEAGMLYWLAERNSIKLEGKVRKLLSNFWYKFRLDDLADYLKTALPVKAVVVTPTTSHQRRDHVSSVQQLLEVIGNKSGSQPNLALVVPPNDPTPKRVLTSADEVLMAKDRLYMHKEGSFHPLYLDEETDELFGTFVDDEHDIELDAIIRNAGKLDFVAMKDIWKVKVIGMKDDSFTVMCICTHPLGQAAERPLAAA